jgi:hypothetical protein
VKKHQAQQNRVLVKRLLLKPQTDESICLKIWDFVGSPGTETLVGIQLLSTRAKLVVLPHLRVLRVLSHFGHQPRHLRGNFNWVIEPCFNLAQVGAL